MTPYWTSRDGRHVLYHGDCLAVLPTLAAGSVDAVVTDPPYGIVNQFGVAIGDDGGRRTLQFPWDAPDITERVVLPGVAAALGLCRKTSACFVFCGADQFGRILELPRAAGFTAKPAAWAKQCPPPAGKGNWWPSAFELAVYGYRSSPYFGDTDPKRCNLFWADSYRHGQPGKVDHPTQKPLELIERIVNAVVPPGGLAIDPFAGSGTTGVACIRTGRRFIGVELEERYCKIAVRRMERELAARPLPGMEPEAEREDVQPELFAEVGT